MVAAAEKHELTVKVKQMEEQAAADMTEATREKQKLATALIQEKERAEKAKAAAVAAIGNL